jgi:hypothetical protein
VKSSRRCPALDLLVQMVTVLGIDREVMVNGLPSVLNSYGCKNVGSARIDGQCEHLGNDTLGRSRSEGRGEIQVICLRLSRGRSTRDSGCSVAVVHKGKVSREPAPFWSWTVLEFRLWPP